LRLADNAYDANHGVALPIQAGSGSGHAFYLVNPAAQLFNATTNVNLSTDTIDLGYRHGFINNTAIVYDAGAFPAIRGLERGTVYYAIVDPAHPTQLQLAATPSGSAIDLTSAPAAPQHSVSAYSSVAKSTDFGPKEVSYYGGPTDNSIATSFGSGIIPSTGTA